MSAESTIKAVLEADATLLALATGGIYSFDEAGSEGINRTTTPAAFDSDGVLKPCILISSREPNPDPSLQDDAGQFSGVREVIELYCFQFGGYSVIRSMGSRCYVLLHAQRLTGLHRVEWAGNFRIGRDIPLDAFVVRIDYLTVYVRSGA